VFHPSDNEFVRTNTLTKGSIVAIDAVPHRNSYERLYGRSLGRAQFVKPANVSDKVSARWESLAGAGNIAANLISQFDSGRILACISSRPGQCGRADGYILEGEELDFYLAHLTKKGKK
jgi:small subunit ribosomal protein S8e